MAETIGAIQVVASINTKDYDAGKKYIETGNKDLEKSSEKASADISAKWSGAFKAIGAAAAVGLAAAGAAAVSIVTQSVKSFAEYEQLVGGVETLFKRSSDAVVQYADNAFRTAGLSSNKYMETVTSFSASLLQGLGGDTEKAAKIANRAITDMADNANKMGTSIEAIQFAYQGFAKDNFTMLDNLKLGYGGTQAEMARLVNESGVLGTSFKATAENVASIPFDKLIEAIGVIQDRLGITGTTAKEASSTITGSFLSAQAAWQNLIAVMADPEADMGKFLDQFVDSAKTFGKNVIPAISRALAGVVDLIDGLAPVLVAELPKLLSTLLPPLINTTIKIFVALVNALSQALPILIKGFAQLVLGLARALPTIFTTLINALLSLIPVIISTIYDPNFMRLMLQAGYTLFSTLLNAIPMILNALIAALPTIISALVGFYTDPATILTMTKAAVKLFMALVFAVPQILSALVKAFADLLVQLWARIKGNFTTFAASFGSSIGDAVKSGINGVLRWINNQVNNIIDNINGMLRVIDDAIPGDQSGLRLPRLNIPMLAEGGVVSSATLAMIGEGSEPEAVIPLSKLDDMLSGGGDGGTTIENNIDRIYIGSEVDGEEWLRKLTRDSDVVSYGMTPRTNYGIDVRSAK